MSQSTVIALAISALFVVYITLKGELPAYLGVFGIGAGGAQPAMPGTTTPTTPLTIPTVFSGGLSSSAVGAPTQPFLIPGTDMPLAQPFLLPGTDTPLNSLTLT